jgi:four helix bundle protein
LTNYSGRSFNISLSLRGSATAGSSALATIEEVDEIPRDPINGEIASQLTDAPTSVAARYRAVCRAKSRADFVNKLSGAIEGVDESAIWLEILMESGICASSKT